jgi:hydroxymethylpyrimidine/phosphomethylpyrimidine kinase
MSKKNNYILTIAGFDPSGGAGVLADIKTFEQHQCIGMAVQTANTIQTEDEFVSVNWLDEKIVISQLEVLVSKYKFEYVKIGLIPNLEFLQTVISILKANDNTVKIIWDPILSASAGFDFKYSLNELESLLNQLYLITPNWDEVKVLSKNNDALIGAKFLSQFTKVILKGGHNETDLGKDYLFQNGIHNGFNPKKTVKPIFAKHGSGCVFSSAITSNLQQGYPLHKSILKSKRYMEGFLSSNNTLIGKHRL